MKIQNNQNASLFIPLAILFFFCAAMLYILGAPASYVWVMDEGNFLNETYLVKMCPDGTRLLEVQFGQSGAIGIDPIANVVWAPEMQDIDRINYDQIVKIDSNGNILNRFQGHRTSLLAVDPNDGSVWTSNPEIEPSKELIAKVDSNGKIILRVGGFSSVSAIALDPRDGSVWVADGFAHRLTHLNTDRERLFEATTEGFFSNTPHQIAVNPENGEVWYGGMSGKITKLSADGQILAEIGGFDRPVAVAIDPFTHNVWVADFTLTELGAVLKLDSDGKLVFAVAMPSHPHIVGINPFDKTVWVGIEGEIIKFYDNGEISARLGDFNKPISIAFCKSNGDLMTKIKCAYYFYANSFK